MEEYVKKRNYLNHLKQISAIKNGHLKSDITLTKSRLSQLNLNSLTQNMSKFTNTSSKFNISKRTNSLTSIRNKSTEQIMKSFSIEKQNLRLVDRISSMNSQISMKKFQKDYIQNKKLMKIHSKIKIPKQFFKFKIFDIKFQDHLMDPDQVFAFYEIVKQKKKFITKGTIFQLRKQQIKTSINQVHLIKIQGNNSGLVQLTMNCFLPIKRNKQQIGNLIIDII